jgi:hypothetical protein
MRGIGGYGRKEGGGGGGGGGRQLDPILSDFLSDGINTVRRFKKTDSLHTGRQGRRRRRSHRRPMRT